MEMVMRLAEEKACRISDSTPGVLVIGSDQVAVIDGSILSKPGTHDNAVVQLRAVRGRCVEFLTAVCLINSTSGKRQTDCVTTEVYFRDLTDEQIENYLSREQPYECAGSFKSEQLGIALVEKMAGPDPSSIIGLPLIRLCEMLENEGVKIL